MTEKRPVTPAAITVLTVAGLADIALGLIFIFAGAPLFGLEPGVALIVGVVLIVAGLALIVMTRMIGRRRGRRAPGEGVIDRR